MQHFTDPDGLYKKEFYSNPEFEFPISEDCLYLNIWTPAENPTDNLPVIVWIHGGGFEHGFSTELEFDGAEYCKRNVILATISYRVNAFGFLYDTEQEKEIGHSGNQGLQDQMAALTWIKENIQAFGGDPDNITLMGQSAGAMSTQILCLSPLSSPMLHQAILQSGGGLSPMSGTFFSKEEAWELTREYYKLCGVTTMKELLPFSAEFLLNKADELMAAHTFLPFRPVVDGYVLPDTPEAMGKRKELAKIPYLMGATKDDLGIPENAVSHRESTFFQSAVSYGKCVLLTNFHRSTFMNSAGIFQEAMTELFTPANCGILSVHWIGAGAQWKTKITRFPVKCWIIGQTLPKSATLTEMDCPCGTHPLHQGMVTKQPTQQS